mgnify:CR=1 FL=1
MKQHIFDGKNNIVGDRAQKMRIKLGLSQAELAARMQAQGVGISRIELGERIVTDYEALALSKALRVPITWLLGDES